MAFLAAADIGRRRSFGVIPRQRPTLDQLFATNGWVMAHRGAGRMVGRDNFVSAKTIGAAYSPMMLIDGGDVRQLSDDSFAVMHDDDASVTCTGTGTISTLTEAEFTALDAKTTGTEGGTTPQGRLENIPGPAVEHPPMVHRVLERFRGRAVLDFELKAPLTTDGMDSLCDLIESYGMQDSVQLECFDLDAATEAATRGIRTGLLANAESDFTSAQVIASGCAVYSPRFVSASWDDTYLEALETAGIGVYPWYTPRRSVWATWSARPGVIGFVSDDPLYALGVNKQYATDQFDRGLYLPGMVQSDNSTRAYIDDGKLVFDADAAGQWMLMGHMARDEEYQQINFSITFDQLDTTTSRWAGLHIASVDDGNQYFFSTGSSASGITALIRQTGSMELSRATGTGSTSIATHTSTAPTAGQTIPFTLVRSSDTFTLTRTDTGTQVSGADPSPSTGRSGYFHVGKSGSSSGTRIHVSFGEISTA